MTKFAAAVKLIITSTAGVVLCRRSLQLRAVDISPVRASRMVGVVTKSVGLHRRQRSTSGGAPTPSRSAPEPANRPDPRMSDADRRCCSLVGASIVMEVQRFHDAQEPDRRLSMPDYLGASLARPR
jgi:hypothetical protein